MRTFELIKRSNIFTERLQAGAEVQVNKMNVPGSFLPRQMNTKVQFHLLQHRVNGFEVRVFDQVMCVRITHSLRPLASDEAWVEDLPPPLLSVPSSISESLPSPFRSPYLGLQTFSLGVPRSSSFNIALRVPP